MEVLFLTLYFYAIVLLGAGLAAALLVRSISADAAYVDEIEKAGDKRMEPVTEPAWVRSQATAGSRSSAHLRQVTLTTDLATWWLQALAGGLHMTTNAGIAIEGANLLEPYCAGCGGAADLDSTGVNIGDLRYHAECAPACATCGRKMKGGEVGWMVQGTVLSTAFGYSVHPTAVWCPGCLDAVRVRSQRHSTEGGSAGNRQRLICRSHGNGCRKSLTRGNARAPRERVRLQKTYQCTWQPWVNEDDVRLDCRSNP
jgi:hypothetical protein